MPVLEATGVAPFIAVQLYSIVSAAVVVVVCLSVSLSLGMSVWGCLSVCVFVPL